ncbi:MAG: hypothetical protein ACYTG4_08550 [Planctomycetota bacterium]|jgi:hypothetical protein
MPLDDDYFRATLKRRALASALEKAEKGWLRRREHSNAYRHGCVKAWDSRGVPVTLDLHGFKAATARDVTNEFHRMVRKARLPCWGLIYGTGEVLGEVVAEVLEGERGLEVETFNGHCYVEDDRGDDGTWPGCGLEFSPQVSRRRRAAPAKRGGCARAFRMAVGLIIVATMIAGLLRLF